jgi:hypothetical protein
MRENRTYGSGGKGGAAAPLTLIPGGCHAAVRTACAGRSGAPEGVPGAG